MDEQPASPRILILGAGFSGLGAAILLKRAGLHDITLIDRASEVGGVWRDNRYPGCACDIPSHLYSFSFDADFDWAAPYAGQPQILAYLHSLVDRHGLRDLLRLNTEVRSAHWDEAAQRWRLRLSGGEELHGEVLISAIGGLVQPAPVDIAGLDSFRGTVFHSARWRPEVALDGRRLALIGSGASAVQIGPELARRAGHLDVFQRTAPWVLPRGARPYGRLRRWLFRRVPGLLRLNRWRIYLQREGLALAFLGHSWLQRLLERMALRHLRRQVPDRDLRDRLKPAGTLGCKRVLLSDDWYPALGRPNVALVSEPIERVVPEGILTCDGRLHRSDVIVLATGFTPSGGLARTFGRDGQMLGALWKQQGAQAHLGLAVHGFPNLFLLLGPASGLGSNSMIFMLEAQLAHVVQAVQHLARHGGALEVRRELQEAEDRERQERLQRSVWASGCQSWYRSALGRLDGLWPGLSLQYWWRTRRFRPADYQVVAAGPAAVLPSSDPSLHP